MILEKSHALCYMASTQLQQARGCQHKQLLHARRKGESSRGAARRERRPFVFARCCIGLSDIETL